MNMLLAIDVGNTNIVFALFDGEEQKQSWRCSTDPARSADEYAVFLKQLFELSKIKWGDISRAVIGSVVPEANFNLARLCQDYLNTEAVFVTVENANLMVDLDRPGEVGADRLANAAAVIAAGKTPAIVIDFGTATTFDVIDRKGIYKGGVIAPGVHLSIEALHSRAAKLPKVAVRKPKTAIGRNTDEAMRSGIFWGYIGLIEGIVTKIVAEMDGKAHVVATGGLASLYAGSTDAIHEVDEDLTLKGLLKIYKSIKK